MYFEFYQVVSILLSTVNKLIVLLCITEPFTRNFLQFSIIELKIEGTPGSKKHFFHKSRSCARWSVN